MRDLTYSKKFSQAKKEHFDLINDLSNFYNKNENKAFKYIKVKKKS